MNMLRCLSDYWRKPHFQHAIQGYDLNNNVSSEMLICDVNNIFAYIIVRIQECDVINSFVFQGSLYIRIVVLCLLRYKHYTINCLFNGGKVVLTSLTFFFHRRFHSGKLRLPWNKQHSAFKAIERHTHVLINICVGRQHEIN